MSSFFKSKKYFNFKSIFDKISLKKVFGFMLLNSVAYNNKNDIQGMFIFN
jgi:hypothetical protein